ncbi:phosphoesterase family-domain-containing protein [Zopfochytrium polystomum]|nr:phosphoesterase family-domain-containing protein [Zopfochytrium polystomum]
MTSGLSSSIASDAHTDQPHPSAAPVAHSHAMLPPPSIIYPLSSDSVRLTPSSATASLPVPGKWFDRIMIVNLENTDYTDSSRDSAKKPHHFFFKPAASKPPTPAPAPVLQTPTPPPSPPSLPTDGGQSTPPPPPPRTDPPPVALLTRYKALGHPSQPNYIAQICGDTVVRDDEVYDVSISSVVDLLERRGVSWRAYMEDYPDLNEGEIYRGRDLGTYVRRHNPFMSIKNIQTNVKRASNIVSGNRFQKDLAEGNLPQYIFYTPNQMNNGHDTNIHYAGNYIRDFLVPLLRDPRLMSAHTLVVLTFDETAMFSISNRVATWLIGSPVNEAALRTGKGDANGCKKDEMKYSHFSLLRTVEDNWSLGSLNRADAKATPFLCLKEK